MNNKNTFIVAEMACSHEGNIDLGKKIIDASAAAHADAVQLQIWSRQYMMSPQRKEYSLLEQIELSRDEWRELVEYTREKHPNLQIYVCVYEHSTIDFIESLGIDGYKVNSSDLSNPLVLDQVAATGKPINLSVGASTIDEIRLALQRIESVSKSPITLMYGHQSFPTKSEDVNLSYMGALAALFGIQVGYQDHSDADLEAAFWLPAASMGMGVSVLEKHITHNRSLKGVDHESALNPNEFVSFVEMVRTIDESKGKAVPREFSKDEKKYRQFQKKSVVLSHDMKAGSIISDADVAFLRAETLGYSPAQIELVIGKKLKNDTAAYEVILEESLLTIAKSDMS